MPVTHRLSMIAAALIVTAVGCDDPTAPVPDFDGSQYPYIVGTQGVRHFGTSRLLVIPARFHDGAPMPLTSAELQMDGRCLGGRRVRVDGQTRGHHERRDDDEAEAATHGPSRRAVSL